MNEWEKVNGKTVKVTELDSKGRITITTNKSKLLIQFSRLCKWYNSLDFSILPTFICDLVETIGWIIIAISLGLLLAGQILRSIDYIISR